ncbi:hypothetical protein L394_01260 [Klebsiella pneumoniae MGH 48]|uniref:hypothetical protein n=1 Tax=Klebsiella pneumoniae TaxID=573 RepID=UPI0003BE9A50|nr:hypothetical protein [Klebsiella pneumoniae]ESM57763.1 hypothetical protein L394_01260 [Klebsiella pneumoniae MGH 48]MDV0617078.1 hypothetical protein [Klebsiella pneumoniae]
MNIEAVNELIASLESAGEPSIREQKFLKLAKAFKQLAAENVQIKAMNDCLSEELRGYESDGAFEGPKMHLLWWQVETPATDRIVAGIKADGAKAAGDYLKLEAQHMPVVERLMMQDAAEICYGTAAMLREGADK